MRMTAWMIVLATLGAVARGEPLRFVNPDGTVDLSLHVFTEGPIEIGQEIAVGFYVSRAGCIPPECPGTNMIALEALLDLPTEWTLVRIDYTDAVAMANRGFFDDCGRDCFNIPCGPFDPWCVPFLSPGYFFGFASTQVNVITGDPYPRQDKLIAKFIFVSDASGEFVVSILPKAGEASVTSVFEAGQEEGRTPATVADFRELFGEAENVARKVGRTKKVRVTRR